MTIRIHYETVLAAVEAFAAQALRLQVLDPSDRDYGGFRCPEHWVCEPLAAANTLASLSVLYMTSDSQYYRNSELSNRLHLAIRFLTHSQRAGGTVEFGLRKQGSLYLGEIERKFSTWGVDF